MAEQFEKIVNVSKDIISLITRDYIYEVVNDAYCQTMEKSRDEILGKKVQDVWGEEQFNKQLKRYFDRCFSGEQVDYVAQFRFGNVNRHMYVSYRPYFQDGLVTHAIVFSRDVTRHKEVESRLFNYEYRDPVTGLDNRRSFEMFLEKELQRTRRAKTHRCRALLFVGLEDFARINQIYGHHIGDILMENSGIRLKMAIRDSDFVFRFDGRELAVVLTQLSHKTDVAKVANKIITDLAIPYRHRGGDIMIQSRIGIVLFPDDGDSVEELVKKASAALDEARARSDPFLFYNSALQDKAIEKLNLEKDMQQAFGNQEFSLVYQPIVDRDGMIQGAEALIRWNHPDRGLLEPGLFIPLAEETGIIVAIGKWALYQVCLQLKTWSEQYDIYVSVNISAREFESSELVDIVRDALLHTGNIATKYLKLEITETESMRNPDLTIARMRELAEAGIDILIDDFGTGHSSLRYLKQLPAEILKIDKVFVDDIADDKLEEEYLASILEMARSRRKKVVVEGVATERQAMILRKLKCDRMQGFYFSRPLPVDEFEKLLAQGKSLFHDLP